MIDRRFDVRIPVADAVSVRWADPTGQRQQVSLELADISRSGASIRAQHPMKVGSMLSLDYQEQELVGTVRSCIVGPTGYVLGIEFEDGYRWKPRR
jgi:hypothetical protein